MKLIEILRKALKESQIARIDDWILGHATVKTPKEKITDEQLVCPKCISDDLELVNAWIDNPSDSLRAGVISKTDKGARINFHYDCNQCGFGFEDSIRIRFKAKKTKEGV